VAVVAALGALGTVAPPTAGAAEGVTLPPEVQAALLKKVFLFDPALAGGAPVLVVFGEASDEEAAGRLVVAFRAIQLQAEAVPATAAAEWVPRVGVVYFLGGTDDEALRGLCVEHRRLSVAGSAAFAEQGRVAVAVALSTQGSPEIVVHRGRLEQEGHRLEPRVLKLARLVG
jgi:hypothetical protein